MAILTQQGFNKLSPAEFGSIINDIEYQKTYLFKIHLPDIDFGDGNIISPNDEFDFCTSATSFPVMTTTPQPVSFYNSELKFAKMTTFSNWNATFKLDINRKAFTLKSSNISNIEIGNSYEYFYYWQMSVYDPITRTSTLPNIYKAKIDLILLNESAKAQEGFTLEGAFPASISGGNLAYTDDGILTYSVDFAFDRFIINDIERES
jgi:hypothetical protein